MKKICFQWLSAFAAPANQKWDLFARVGPLVPSQVILLLAGPMKMTSWKNKKNTKRSIFCRQGQLILNGFGLILFLDLEHPRKPMFLYCFLWHFAILRPFSKKCILCLLAPSKNNERAAHPLGKPINTIVFWRFLLNDFSFSLDCCQKQQDNLKISIGFFTCLYFEL